MNELVVVPEGASLLYERMEAAIDACHACDDCKEIADQASAIAAYYKQVKDDSAVRKFHEVRQRAWRRIGEICSLVDRTGCETKSAYAERIHEAYSFLSFSQIHTALRLAEVPSEYFEENIRSAGGGLANIPCRYQHHLDMQYWETPEGKAEKARREKVDAADQKRRAQEERRYQEQIAKQREEEAHKEEILQDIEEAIKEVGYTMDRRDRKKMKSIVLLVNDSLHAVLRQAAFDNHMTMQAILRKGLEAWLLYHGYEHGERTHSDRKSSEGHSPSP